MNKIKINWVKTDPEAMLPKKNHPEPLTGDAGFDIFLTEDVEILPRKSAIIDVGLKVGYITPGYWFRVEGRSGLGFKKDLLPFLGIIDNSYRGKLGIKIYNNSYDVQTVKKGQAIAQIIVYEMIDCVMGWQNEVSPVDGNARGEKGFGSSDAQAGEMMSSICPECGTTHFIKNNHVPYICICEKWLVR